MACGIRLAPDSSLRDAGTYTDFVISSARWACPEGGSAFLSDQVPDADIAVLCRTDDLELLSLEQHAHHHATAAHQKSIKLNFQTIGLCLPLALPTKGMISREVFVARSENPDFAIFCITPDEMGRSNLQDLAASLHPHFMWILLGSVTHGKANRQIHSGMQGPYMLQRSGGQGRPVPSEDMGAEIPL